MMVIEKVPAPTPPHKGEGLNPRPSPHSSSSAEHAAGLSFCEAVPRSSPSPLWGGVGEGFYDHTARREGETLPPESLKKRRDLFARHISKRQAKQKSCFGA